MPFGPVQIQPAQRALLAQFEQRYEHWCAASAAADEAERELARQLRELELGMGTAPEAAQVRRALELRAEAFRLQREAMQMLRDEPL